VKAVLAAALVTLAMPAAAMVPLPPTCQEADGWTSTQWSGYGPRFRVLDRIAADGRRELALVDCQGSREVRAVNDEGAGLPAENVVDTALRSRQKITFEGLVRMLRAEGHEARIMRVGQPSCMCREVPG
jgi:hypothetical protein